MAYEPSVSNFRLPLLSLSPYCNDKKCLLSHKLVEYDKQNLGKYYRSLEHPTNLFVRICNNCLLAKFGLYESDNNENTSFLNCIMKKTQNDNNDIRREGPYLKAYKVIENLVDHEEIVFKKNTIILPSGVLLLDLLMCDRETLFNNNLNVPKIQINSSNNESTEYFLNPYIFGYFHHIHDFQTSPFTRSVLELEKIKNFEEMLYQNTEYDSNTRCLAGIYESEAFMMSNLIHPLGAVSTYVRKGHNFKTSTNKTLLFNHEIVNTDNKNDPELALSNKHINVNITVDETELLGETKLDVKKVKGLNQIIQTSGLSMRQLIVNRKKGLTYYFTNNNENFYSAIALHVLSFCVPSKITDSSGKIYRTVYPNVTFKEGIGLVSTNDICKHELLIANTNISLDNFIRLKLNRYETGLKYNKLGLTDNPKQLSYVFEGRNREADKACLYANFS